MLSAVGAPPLSRVVRRFDHMSRNRKLARCLAAMFALLLAGCSTVGPLCRSDEKIRASVLKRTPLRCSRDQVYAFIKQHRWPVYYESRDRGFMMSRPGQPSVEVGSRAVGCELGVTHFVYFPFETTVLAYWGFDKSGRLIDLWIDQQTDAL